MIVEPIVPRELPRKDSINPLSKKQNLGILTFYKVMLFKLITIKIKIEGSFYNVGLILTLFLV